MMTFEKSLGLALALALTAAAPTLAAPAKKAAYAARPWGPAKTYKTSWEHYLALKAAAHGGQKKTFAGLPDWTGLWERDARPKGWPYPFDLTENPEGPTTAKLTPEYQAKFEKKMADYKKGIEWDSLSYCLPAGFPRWLTEPRPREYIVRPEAVWMSTEQQSEFWGQSFVANPYGEIVAKASVSDEEILIVPCDLSAVEDFRRIWPFFRDRRIDTYAPLTKRYIDE